MADENRTEKATPRKKEDERKKGNIFQSKDLTSVLTLVIIAFVMKALAPYFLAYLKDTIVYYIKEFPSYNTLGVRDASKVFSDMSIRLLILALPLAITAAAVTTVLTLAQTRMNFSKEQIRFKFSRINLFNGVRNLISLKSLIELTKAILKISIITFILYSDVKSNLNIILRLIGSDVAQAVYRTAGIIVSMIFRVCVIMIVFSILDLLYQWWDYERRLRMTKQEVKNENKQTEGDPLLKGKIRERQRSVANMRMMKKIPEADFVVRNPTHYAVAIKYDPESKKHKAPVVIAKGRGYIALKIIEIAEQNKVTVTENRLLARALYKSVKVGRENPSEFYQAVAELLAFVYNLKKRERLNEVKE